MKMTKQNTVSPGIQVLSDFEIESVSGGLEPTTLYAIRIGAMFLGAAGAGVVIGGLVAYTIYKSYSEDATT